MDVICFKSDVLYGIVANLFLVMGLMLPLKLLQILTCPLCKGELVQSTDELSLLCSPCGRLYPVVDGIPVLLPRQVDSAPQLRRETE